MIIAFQENILQKKSDIKNSLKLRDINQINKLYPIFLLNSIELKHILMFEQLVSKKVKEMKKLLCKTDSKCCTNLTDWGLLLLRLIVGFFMLTHGWAKLSNFAEMSQQARRCLA